MLALKGWNAESVERMSDCGVGGGKGWGERDGMLDFRGGMLGKKQQNVGMGGMNVGFEQGGVGAKGERMPGARAGMLDSWVECWAGGTGCQN